jgi:hypothetical protein
MSRRFLVAFFLLLVLAFMLHSLAWAEQEEVPPALPTPATLPVPVETSAPIPTPQDLLPDEMEYFVHFAVYAGGTFCGEMDTTVTTSRPIQSYDLPKLKEHLRSEVDEPCKSGTVVIRSVVRIPIL